MSDEIDSTAEEWRAIPGFEGWYSVSSFGRVRRDKFSKKSRAVDGILKFIPDPKGYHRVALYTGKKSEGVRRKVHRLVAMAFIPNPDAKSEVNHKNGTKHDNRVENLEWATSQENIQHSFRELGREGGVGERNPAAKLSDENVIEIRNIYAIGLTSQAVLAAIFGVSQAHISGIVLRKTWTHVN